MNDYIARVSQVLYNMPMLTLYLHILKQYFFHSFVHVKNGEGKDLHMLQNCTVMYWHRKPKPSCPLSRERQQGGWFLNAALTTNQSFTVFFSANIGPVLICVLVLLIFEWVTTPSVSSALWMQVLEELALAECPLHVQCWRSLAPFHPCTSSKANRKLHLLPASPTCLPPFEENRNGWLSCPPACVQWHCSLQFGGEDKMWDKG